MSSGTVRRVSRQDIQLVQNLIERCLQLYMNQKEVVETLLEQAKIEPGFTELVWQKLEEENREFFKAYYLRLMVKQQIMEFNKLLEQQVHHMQQMHPSGVTSVQNTNGSHIQSMNQKQLCYASEHTDQSLKSDAHHPMASSLSNAYLNGSSTLNTNVASSVNISTHARRLDASPNMLSSSSAMASSTLFKLHSQTFKSLNPSPSLSYHPKSRISDLHLPRSLSRHPRRLNKKSTSSTRFFVPLCSSLPSPSSPPISKEEAILQAKTCLSSCLIKPLNNPKLASPKLKKLKQPRFRLEIPILDDDSPPSLSQLAFSIFSDIPISRRGSSNVKLLFLWPDPSFIEPAVKAFRSDNTNHIAISPVSESVYRALRSSDVAVFMAPERSQLEDVRTATEGFATKPVVMINPRWLFEEEKSFGDEFNGFIGSFDVIYAFTGLEVRGILSKRKGVIFKCVRDGVVSGERWNVLVEEEEGNGTLKVVSQFKARPSMEEVELVLYNLMAMNSPITKSAKFLKDLVSNITGKK